MAARPPVPKEQLSSHWTDFHEFWYLSVFRKYVEEIEVSLKSDKNNGYFTWRPFYICYHISLNSSENEKCSDRLCRENQNIYFTFNNFYQTSCPMWGNVEKYCRAEQATDDNIARAH